VFAEPPPWIRSPLVALGIRDETNSCRNRIFCREILRDDLDQKIWSRRFGSMFYWYAFHEHRVVTSIRIALAVGVVRPTDAELANSSKLDMNQIQTKRGFLAEEKLMSHMLHPYLRVCSCSRNPRSRTDLLSIKSQI
jgi:hypothetical protein